MAERFLILLTVGGAVVVCLAFVLLFLSKRRAEKKLEAMRQARRIAEQLCNEFDAEIRHALGAIKLGDRAGHWRRRLAMIADEVNILRVTLGRANEACGKMSAGLRAVQGKSQALAVSAGLLSGIAEDAVARARDCLKEPEGHPAQEDSGGRE